jgi:hypothetical protein
MQTVELLPKTKEALDARRPLDSPRAGRTSDRIEVNRLAWPVRLLSNLGRKMTTRKIEMTECYVSFDTEDGVAEMPLARLLAPERTGNFTKVIYKDGNSRDLRARNLLRATERQLQAWYLLLQTVDTDEFEELLTSSVKEFSDDLVFVYELLSWFHPMEAEDHFETEGNEEDKNM